MQLEVIEVKEVAKILGVHPETVRRLTREGKLTYARRIANAFVYDRGYIESYATQYDNSTGRPKGGGKW